MRHFAAISIIGIMGLVGNAAAADACQTGRNRLTANEPCIPDPLFNYLYCLIQSGRGVVEVRTSKTADDKTNVEVGIKGAGSGVIIKGEVGVDFKKSTLAHATDEIQAKLSPDLAKTCKEMADGLRDGVVGLYKYPAAYKAVWGGGGSSNSLHFDVRKARVEKASADDALVYITVRLKNNTDKDPGSEIFGEPRVFADSAVTLGYVGAAVPPATKFKYVLDGGDTLDVDVPFRVPLKLFEPRVKRELRLQLSGLFMDVALTPREAPPSVP